MDRIKCKQCNVVNFATDDRCKRCGSTLWIGGSGDPSNGPREKARRSTFLWTLLFLTLVGAAAYYLYNGFGRSFDDVNKTEANRVAQQPANQAPQPANRSESDGQRKGAYFTALQNNNSGMSQANSHTEEIKKLTR